MKYMLVYNQTAADIAQRDDPAKAPAYWGAWRSYMGELHAAGLIDSGSGLLGPETATMVRVRDGKRLIQDGPFADTKEHLGGYIIMDAPSLDIALQWAERAPCVSTGTVEVRPVMPPMGA
jgi:hypothetical protein